MSFLVLVEKVEKMEKVEKLEKMGRVREEKEIMESLTMSFLVLLVVDHWIDRAKVNVKEEKEEKEEKVGKEEKEARMKLESSLPLILPSQPSLAWTSSTPSSLAFQPLSLWWQEELPSPLPSLQSSLIPLPPGYKLLLLTP